MTIITFEHIRNEVKKGIHYGTLVELCTSMDTRENWKIRVFFGQGRGRTDGIPLKNGSYYTQNWGMLSDFQVSTAKIGDIVTDEDGNQWRVIVNQYVVGDAAVPSSYHFVVHRVTPDEYPLPE